MNDLYGATGGAIAAGNSRMDIVRDYNQKVKEHNDTIHNTIQGLKDQAQSAAQVKEIKDQALNLWAAKDIPGKAKEFNKYFADRAAGKAKGSNPVDNTKNSLSESNEAPDVSDGMKEGQTTTEPPSGDPVAEGATQGESVSEATEGADAAVGEGLETSLKGAKAAGKSALKGAEGAIEGAEGLAGKASGLLGKVGVLGSAAIGGMDLYEDIKHHQIQGNNTWEKASNILQIGGSIGDIVGSFFPPAKLIGGVLDIASGITDSVGEKVEEDKTEQDLKGQEQSETESTETVQDVERQDPGVVARTALTAVTGRTQ